MLNIQETHVNLMLVPPSPMTSKQELEVYKRELTSVCRFIEYTTEDLEGYQIQLEVLSDEYFKYMATEYREAALMCDIIKDSFQKRIDRLQKLNRTYERNIDFLEGVVGLLETKMESLIDQIASEEVHT